MLRYLKYSSFQGIISAHTKDYQHEALSRLLPEYAKSNHRVAEIGANLYFDNLLQLRVRERYVIDPYNGGPGGGAESPPDFPEDLVLLRCAIGVTSRHLADDFFDLIFSSSVLEHVGQAEVGYDVSPVFTAAQEPLRNACCAELFRILKPGGVTLHTIDHAPHNRFFSDNFTQAGFVPLVADESLSVEHLLNDPDAVRQRVDWIQGDQAIDRIDLHSVLLLGFKKQ
jgi:SAM-dependent methyltransferase